MYCRDPGVAPGTCFSHPCSGLGPLCPHRPEHRGPPDGETSSLSFIPWHLTVAGVEQTFTKCLSGEGWI